MANRLAAATSPYLLQHADNPVDWWEWGDEAFAEARRLDRPVLLSVGYSACHWCHVMAHESFEDPDTAALMNAHFVNVKVDREERPDVDRIYMDAVQAMTGHGGWPMTVFLTPAGKPFFAGTYFPSDDHPNHPSFRRVMRSVAAAWEQQRNDVEQQAERLTSAVRRRVAPADSVPDSGVLERAVHAMAEAHDREHGGFGGAPKFPQAPNLDFLLRIASRAPVAGEIARATLHAMAAGGIYDHLGGGFARYSVDRRWLVPHFEKMLYDNALLARVYLRAWQVLGDDRFRMVAEETYGYLLRDLALPGGGFATAEDADSEGEEGKFYVFDHADVLAAGGAAGPLVAEYFGASPEGNFEGANILHHAAPLDEVARRHGLPRADAAAAVAAARIKLMERRNGRIRPARDDKVIAAWNGLALRALAEGGAVLGRTDLLRAAAANAEFVLGHLRRRDGRLLRTWRAGTAAIPGFCEDYAAFALGLLALYQADGDVRWYRVAAELGAEMVDLFAADDGTFFDTGRDTAELITRPRELMDNPTPSANSLAAELLLQLALFTGDVEWRRRFERVLLGGGRLLEAHPQAVGHLLAVLATATAPPREVAVTGSAGDAGRAALVAVFWEAYRHDAVLAWDRGGSDGAAVPLLAGRGGSDAAATAYVCRDFSCELPTTDPAAMRAQLAGSAAAG